MSAPSISSEALPSTPAHEWANETLNSVPSNTEDSTRVAASAPSTATTPGLDFPGAYPKTPSTQVPLGNNSVVSSNGLDAIANQAKQSGTIAAATVGDAANSLPHVGSLGSVGGGLDGVKEALFNATVTASQYLPPKIVEYFPGGSEIVAASNVENRFKDAQGFSLPSTEHSVDPTPSSQGVGSLPGSSSEAGVAKLPLEREIDSNDNLKVQHEDLGTKESLTNASMVAQYGSSVPTPTMEKVSVDAESIPSHFKEDLDQKIPPTSSPTHPSKDDVPVNPAPIHLSPRTHPLAASGVGAHWHNVPLDEEYQRTVVDNSLDVSKGTLMCPHICRILLWDFVFCYLRPSTFENVYSDASVYFRIL
ncbi:hypothetical protein F5890DRAFT_1544631 [Lentinula detonsa]|uniref:Uncharacterized protein n=1 Tax=Lentinula detonsa TaxID=2804962 RepID=A0AA38UNP3_9AGAR|nr:hypothetical protein F5890DRAFT_1544631 [Lentinula detonsa]